MTDPSGRAGDPTGENTTIRTPEPLGPVHQASRPETQWSRLNAGEQIPGILTPLAFTFWIGCADVAVRRTFSMLGALSRGEVRLGATPDERIGAAFHGRWVANVDEFRRLADLTPGVSGADFERDVFGTDRPGSRASTRLRRVPIMLVKGPVAVARLPRTIHRQVDDTREWWHAFTDPGRVHDPAVAQLREAVARATDATSFQMLGATIGQSMFARLGQLCARAGRPDLHLSLSIGYGEMEESKLISAIYDIVEGRATLDRFLSVHGARGPAEVDLAARSYRENPDAVRKLVAKYRAAPGKSDPTGQSAAHAQRRAAAEDELVRALPAIYRPAARLLMRLARIYVPLREEGKSTMVMAIDAARSAARRRGRELAEAGVLTDADDVFYLTLDEILDGPPTDAAQLVADRKLQEARYDTVTLPVHWRGTPVPAAPELVASDDNPELTGLAAASGSVEGLARVILDADACDELEPDEILVCRTTDPSWASAFHLSSGVVIDIGGLASHGAIVCREMGLPCVIGTGDGTRRIRTGDRLLVDGSRGQVTIVERAGSAQREGRASGVRSNAGVAAEVGSLHVKAAAPPPRRPRLRLPLRSRRAGPATRRSPD